LLFAFGGFGLALHGFVAGQVKLGNGERAPIAFLRRSETGVTIGLWSFLLVGAAVALPAMWRDLFPGPPRLGPSQGILRGDVGMTMDEVRAASTLPIDPKRILVVGDRTQTIGDEVFDLEIRGGTLRFEKCRYYFLRTARDRDPRLDSINVGISPFKRARADS